MAIQLTRQCQPSDNGQGQPGPCRATFTANGQTGNQKLLGGGMITLQADDAHADTYVWEVTSSPPSCDYLLTGATQPQAKLVLPGPGAYVVQLTVTKGSCECPKSCDPLGGDSCEPVSPTRSLGAAAL